MLAAAVFLGTVRVRPWVAVAMSTVVPLILVAQDFFRGDAGFANERISAFLAWGLLIVGMYAIPAFLIGCGAASLGAFLTRDRNRGRSSSDE